MLNMGTRIYVVRFAPSEQSPNGVGGVDWFVERKHALLRLHEHEIDSGYDFSYAEKVLVADMEFDAITDMLDDGSV